MCFESLFSVYVCVYVQGLLECLLLATLRHSLYRSREGGRHRNCTTPAIGCEGNPTSALCHVDLVVSFDCVVAFRGWFHTTFASSF